MTKMFLSKKEFAEAAGISVRTVDNLISAKELSVRRCGRRVLIPISEAEKFAKRDHSTKPKVGRFDPHGQRPEATSTTQQMKVTP